MRESGLNIWRGEKWGKGPFDFEYIVDFLEEMVMTFFGFHIFLVHFIDGNVHGNDNMMSWTDMYARHWSWKKVWWLGGKRGKVFRGDHGSRKDIGIIRDLVARWMPRGRWKLVFLGINP